MNILITGGFGFIGSNLMRYYLSNGDNVTVIDDLSTACISSFPGVHFLNIDLSSPDSHELELINREIQKADLIQHMASSVGVKFIDKDPRNAIRKNSNISHHLFPLFERHQKKVIFASTSEVYGDSEDARETDILKIGSPDVLRWGYACGKLMGEFLLKTYSFPHVIVRFFNVTGKGQLSEHGMVLPTFVERAMNDRPITIYGDGKQYRSFCDIRDAVEILALLGKDNVHNGEIYNLGNPVETYSMKELAELVMELTRKQVSVEFKPYNEELSLQSRDIIKRRPNSEKIQNYYTFKYTVQDTIREMIK